MKGPRLVCSLLVLAVAGCSLPLIGSRSAVDDVAPPVSNIANADFVTEKPPIVQVRSYWHSSVVTIVAWGEDDPAFGLRTSVSRAGKLVGGRQYGDHRLYLTPFLARDMGGFAHAEAEPDQILASVGWQNDSYNCFYGRRCSPMVTLGVRVPDSLLRANRDDFVVTFYPRVLDPWTLTLRRELIDAYLAKVDSVVAEMKKSAD